MPLKGSQSTRAHRDTHEHNVGVEETSPPRSSTVNEMEQDLSQFPSFPIRKLLSEHFERSCSLAFWEGLKHTTYRMSAADILRF